MSRIPLLLILLALAGCVFGSGKSSEATKVPEAMKHTRPVAPKLPDRHPYGDVTRLRTGQWASYREGERSFTLAAVGVAGDRVWIEVIEEGEPRQVSARLVSPDGVIHKAFYGEVSKDGQKSSVEPQTLEQDGSAAPTRLGETGRETGEEAVTVGGRELKSQRVKVRFEDLEGRLTEETTWWHKDVPPIYAGTDAGGLVRRRTGASTIELTGFGTDARPLLEVPR
ncbi:MAG TPA: hypothetical protein VNM14_09410 [Planctomycetota bacterium]|nr:hypothetical protein [Planctomycetota bacterium]